MKASIKAGRPPGVDQYIAAAPKEAQPMLRQLREIITSTAPMAAESLSYGMPYYSYHGRLIYFAAHTHHVGLYVMGRAKKLHAKELAKYQTSKATLQFPFGTRVPVTLVRKLVRDRIEELEEGRKYPGGSHGKDHTVKFGVSWQVVPTRLLKMLREGSEQQTARVMVEVMKMKKLEIAPLKAAYERT